MPWTSSKEGTLPSLKNKSLEYREIFARVANAALDKGQTEEEAIQAGLAAAAANERRKARSVQKEKAVEVPAHLRAIFEAEPNIQKEIEKAEKTSKDIVSAKWDNKGRLTLTFSDGSRIVTDPVPVSENIEQHIGISVNPVFDYLRFNTEANLPELLPGWLSWNSFEDCLDIKHSDGSTLQVGLENHIEVINNTGNTLPNGSVVQFSGVDLQEIPECSPLVASPSFTPLLIIGVLTNELQDGQRGRATVLGKVRQLNTTGSTVSEVWQQGDLLWAHPTIAGEFTKVKPSAPNPAISVAAVLKVGVTDGVILVRPTIFPRLFYAKYLSNQNQQPALINTPYPVTFNITDIESGVSIIDNSKITVASSGLYSFDFRLQVTSTNSSSKNIYIWARKNGIDVPDSATKITLTGNAVETAPSWNFVYTMQAGDYFQLMYATDDTAIVISAPIPMTFCPGTPSAVIKVNQLDL